MISFIIYMALCKKWFSKELQASLWVAVALEIDQVSVKSLYKNQSIYY